MAHETPRQTREGSLIEAAAKASGRSIRQLAANAGISDTRWRHIVRGWQPAPGGSQSPVNAPASTLARMAHAAGVTPEALAETGRTDAADLLARMNEDSAGTALGGAAGTLAAGGNVTFHSGLRRAVPDEIDMIAESKTMSPRQKLERIRLVLALRAEAEAEEAQDRAQQEAPAADAEASVEQS